MLATQLCICVLVQLFIYVTFPQLVFKRAPELPLFLVTTNDCERRVEKHILTYYIVQSPSWEANWFATSQEIPRISRNPKVHYRTHKLPPSVSFLGQPNPVHIPTSHLLDIHPNIIHPSTPRSPQWSPSLQFPHQDPVLQKLCTWNTNHKQIWWQS